MNKALQNNNGQNDIVQIRKEQVYKRWHGDRNKKDLMYAQKPFPKLGILIIIFAVIGIYLANSGPWVHYSAEWKTGHIEESFYKDLEGASNPGQFFLEPPHCFIHGMFSEYFTEGPNLTLYGLYSLLVLGITIILFGLIDKKKNFSIINFHMIQFILYSLVIIPCVFIITAVVRFIQTFIIGGHNIGYGGDLLEILSEDLIRIPKITPIVAYAFIIVSLIIITITFTLIDSNLRRIQEESEINKKKTKSKPTKLISDKINLRYHGGGD